MEADATLEKVRALYEQALFRQAWACGVAEFGPLEQWPGTAGRLLAGRLAWNFGAPRLGNALVSLAYRAARSNPEAAYYRLSAIRSSSGTLAALRFIEKHGDLAGAPADKQADWLAAHASILGSLRDFERARALQDRAETLAPENPWLWVERSNLLEEEDRRKEAVAAVQHALKLRPNYRPALQQGAHLLQSLNRGPQALELLRKASRGMEAPGVTRQFVVALMEAKEFPEAREQAERLVRITPKALRSDRFKESVRALLSDIAYYSGDYETAQLHASQAGKGYFERIAQHLDKAPVDAERRVLEVDFVKQNFVTCAPATLAALSSYWGHEVDHEALAAEICYDGTPDHVERNWVEEQGFSAREFKVTWDSARMLIRRGVPFTVTSGGATWAHLQAIIGFDERRRTFALLEPGSFAQGECLAEEWLESNASFGPRGLAFVPAAEAHRIADLELPDADLYDQRYATRRALSENRREEAAALSTAMQQRWPEHALTLDTQWAIGCYDSDWEACLKLCNQLLEVYRDEPRLQLAKLSFLRSLARSGETLSFLRGIADEGGCDPAFTNELAEELMQDARHWGEAEGLFERSARRGAIDSALFSGLGQLAARRSDFRASSAYHRLASCLAPMSERAAWDYFDTARFAGESEAAIEHLRSRDRTLGDRSGHPAITLYEALVTLARRREAFAVLDAAIELRPTDSELALFAAQSRAAYGNHAEAAQLLSAQRDKANRHAWLRAAAKVARHAGDPERALSHSLELAECLPLDAEAQRSAIHDRQRMHGSDEALDHVERMLDRAPDHLGVQALGLGWLRRERSPKVEAALCAVLERHPRFAWGRRELALLYTETGRLGEAKRAAEFALEQQPLSPASHSVLAEVLLESGDHIAAHVAWRKTIELDVAHTAAIQSWVGSCESNAERRRALAWIAMQLEEQVVVGPGLAAYRQAARSAMDAEEALPLLQRILEARPELRDAWREVVQQLVELGRYEEARAVAARATERFPYDATGWLDLARVERSLHQEDAARVSLEKAIGLAPGWDEPVCMLGEVYQRSGRLEEAATLLRSSIEASPREPRLHAYLAEVLQCAGDLAGACNALERAIEIDPAYEWAWEQHRSWSRDRGEARATSAFAQRLSEQRPSDPEAWLALATCLRDEEALEPAIEAARRGISLAERNEHAHDLLAQLLCSAGRIREAVQACEPEVFALRKPSLLRGRRAWVEARSGDAVGAIDTMRAVVADDNGFYWGWSCLTDWCREAGRLAEAEEAATWLTRLAPRQSSSWHSLADLRMARGDREGAKLALRRGVDAEPSDASAGLKLIDLYLEDDETTPARDLIDILSRHGAGSWAAAREVRLARLIGDEALAESAARKVFTEHCSSDWPVREVIDAWSEPLAKCPPLSEGGAERLLDEEIEAGRACGQALFYRATRSELEAAVPLFERCLAREPGWDAAARALGDALQRSGDAKAATELLTALVERSPDAENEAYLADAHAEAGELAAAIEGMQHAIGLRPNRDWYWQRLSEWFEEAGSSETAESFAIALARSRPTDVGAWLAVVGVCQGADHAKTRIGACRKAIGLEPFELAHHMLHVDLLSEVGNYNAALQACEPTTYQVVPTALQERAARVLAEQGEIEPALRRLRALLKDDPSRVSAWRYGGRWLLEADRADDALRWAETMCQALPECGVALQLRGQALQKLDRADESLYAFREAHALDPSLIAATSECFDQLFEAGEIDEAAPYAAALLHQARDEFALARAIQLGSARGESEASLTLFDELCAVSDESSWPLAVSMDALAVCGLRKKAERRLGAAIDERRVKSEAVALWVTRVALPKRGRRMERRIAALVLDPQVGGFAVQALMRQVPEGRRFERLFRKLRDHLRADTWAWGYAGYALTSHGDYKRVAKWLSDWRKRSGIEPWMLDNLVIALRGLGRWEQAREVENASLGHWGRSPQALETALWSAFDAARAKRRDEACDVLHWIAATERRGNLQLMEDLVWTRLRLDGTRRDPADDEPNLPAALYAFKELGQRARAQLGDRGLRLAYLSLLRDLAARRPGLGGKLWHFTQWLRTLPRQELSWACWYLFRGPR